MIRTQISNIALEIYIKTKNVGEETFIATLW